MLVISWLIDQGSGPINVSKARKLIFWWKPKLFSSECSLRTILIGKQARLKLFGFIKRIATSDSTNTNA